MEHHEIDDCEDKRQKPQPGCQKPNPKHFMYPWLTQSAPDKRTHTQEWCNDEDIHYSTPPCNPRPRHPIHIFDLSRICRDNPCEREKNVAVRRMYESTFLLEIYLWTVPEVCHNLST